MVIWPCAILGVLSLAAGLFAMGGAILAGGAALVWYLDSHGRAPENIVVKSARCRHCGSLGEPHWASCQKCGATNWKAPE
jgi:hypothetical protein